ncbi:unnamed protein product [Candida verbasci]|uniref:Uncharacterized protein n=1 Tax=Candida verbasci TaxID=1227364 RepID=A0A9W4TVP3_9ASCO|nr:unnamed protein product [Candida verbasci]
MNILNRRLLRNSIKPIGIIRFNSNLPESNQSKKQLPTKEEWNHLKLHIPGEEIQTNTLKDRIPKWPLSKEAVPTLLPRPNVPQVGKNFTFKQVITILKNKTKPELIYEAEPHRLYFLIFFAAGFVFFVYGCVLLEWSWFLSNKEYNENEKEETNETIRKRDWFLSFGLYLVPSFAVFSLAYLSIIFPTKLIRRMWYLPGPKEYVKFTGYPLIPGKPTPVYTIPLTNLSRRKTTRIWTGKGFYGTSDKGFFFFVLNEKLPSGRTKSWIVDRKGFFWSDGRVFDYLFGKESLKEAEAGIPYDQQFKIINKELKKKKKQLRDEKGTFWRYKMMIDEVKTDVNKAKNYISGNKKQLPPKSK